MKEERLCGLALMLIEQETTSKLMQGERLDTLVEKFAAFNERRLQLIEMIFFF